ncbi:hypothetical protein BKA82DRAFT_4335007 [Pisolithus tinctorius]|nr:hypothetical protein BKA82DRAFT_4335007 [Pisolithus tinctorius]
MSKAKNIVQTCILDILWHLPRSLFSDVQLQVILWGLAILGVDNSQYRIPSVRYQGALGHIYYVNHLPSIIAQEMANPRVRPHIRHYPEDAGGRLDQPPSRFYVFELAKLMDGTMVVPQRWYTKPSALLTSPPFELEYWARAWRAHPVVSGHTRGYVIHTYDTIEVPASSLLLSFPHLLQTHQVDGQPDPCNIIEMRGHGVLPWTLTDPVVGNIWQSNIHFLATSNIAPPLEMLDGIVAQLEHAQMHGIWAWDIEAREMVLMIPAVLAMLGDNPMQSELACHVGLQGKFFCRNCWVQGVGAESSEHPQVHSRGVSHNGLKGKGRRSETMQGLVDRARRFLGVSIQFVGLRYSDVSTCSRPNTPRTRQHTVEKLRSMFHETRYAKMKTDTGIKDTYMDVFVERILKRVKGIRAGTDGFTEAVNAITQGRSVEEFMSPVWRIKGLDPHQDTPVEVLHVILLGFVKYFWRDAISRMNDDQKAELQVRLASFDTSGLGIPPLAAQTFVQYAGSLTGRDFRAICQAAPFVLYDLVPRECYEAFLALSSLVPLVWQPCINNIDRHLADLRAAIDHFLNCTARWTPRWFNKPKFHILRHLPDHIQRFGPAILFATEGFESYNAIIRDHSIHSNRQAPSRDIARGMARCNRVRHLLSSGKFHARELTELPYSNNEHEWLVPGSGVKSLTSLDIPTFRNVIADYFGLTDDRDPLEAGSCVHDKTRPRPLEKTITALRVPYALPRVERRLYQACRSIVATNGETCRLGDFVLAREPRAAGHELPLIGSLHEILQICHSPAQQRNQANWLLLETFKVTGSADIYHLPRIQPLGWVVLPATAVICCVNVQHNCAGHGCTGSSTVSVYKEREKTTKTAKRIEHCEPLDLILNTAQMRNACHVQRFRTPVQQLDRDWAIHTGAAAEFLMTMRYA